METMTSEHQLLTVPEAARVLRVTPMTVYRMVWEQRLRFVRVGKRGVRIAKSTLDDLISGKG